MFDAFKSDPLFASVTSQLSSYSWMGTSSDLETKHRKLIFLSTARKLNSTAILNISSFLGAPPNKIMIHNKLDTKPGPIVFSVKQ